MEESPRWLPTIGRGGGRADRGDLPSARRTGRGLPHLRRRRRRRPRLVRYSPVPPRHFLQRPGRRRRLCSHHLERIVVVVGVCRECPMTRKKKKKKQKEQQQQQQRMLNRNERGKLASLSLSLSWSRRRRSGGGSGGRSSWRCEPCLASSPTLRGSKSRRRRRGPSDASGSRSSPRRRR